MFSTTEELSGIIEETFSAIANFSFWAINSLES
jgi:hypothetical protein